MVRYGLVDSDSGSNASMDDVVEKVPINVEPALEEDDDAPPRETLFDDEEDEDDQQAADYEAPLYEVSTMIHPHPHPHAVSSPKTSDRDRDPHHHQRIKSIESDVESKKAMAPEPETPLPNTLKKLRTEMGLESKRISVMQKSLFASSSSSLSTALKILPHSNVKFESPTVVPTLAKGLKIMDVPSKKVTSTTQQTGGTHPKYTKSRPLVRRKLQSIPLRESLSENSGGALLDASLAWSRAFGACWCKGNRMASSGSVFSKVESSQSAFSVVNVETIPTLSRSLSKEISLAERLLSIQLKNTVIDIEADVPFASSEPHLRFHHFCKALDVEDRSHEANVWRLGAALFDEIEPRLPSHCKPQAVKRIHAARREAAFSDWLKDAVTPLVANDVRSITGPPTPAITFRYLTGFQIEKACDAAIVTGDIRLSTLVALAGGDSAYRSDLVNQVASWREARIDSHIDDDRRRIYELLSGNVTLSKGYGSTQFHADASKSLRICDGLDWKRAFGLHFWYQASHEKLWYAVKTYEQAFMIDHIVTKPQPWYDEQQASSSGSNKSDELRRWKLPPSEEVFDPLYHMIKLFVDPGHDLEHLLEPRGFSSSPFDNRIPWHLYTILSRSMRKSDFKDRVTEFDTRQQDDEDGLVRGVCEGNSVLADLMTSNYAHQLEQIGIWHWAAFVLLHLDYPQSRVIAIKGLLERNVASLDDVKEEFLVKHLQIPVEWIAEAQAAFAQHEGRIWDQYQRLLKANLMTEAHQVAVTHLLPEAIIHGDFTLLRRLLKGMGPENVADWPYGGKLFIDYANVVDDLPSKLAASRNGDNNASRIVNQRVENDLPRLLREVPTIYGSKTKIRTTKQTVCISEMLSRLSAVANQMALLQEGHQGGVDSVISWSTLHQLQGSDRLAWALSNSIGAFGQALNTACEAY